jgi:type I restriction enzyme, S subunit
MLRCGEHEGVTLDNVFEHVVDRGHRGLPILSVTIDGRIVRRESLDRHVADDTGDEKYLRVQTGDVAYNTMRLWQGAVGIAEEEGLVSPAYTVLRRRNRSLPVVLLWELLRSAAMKRQYRKLVRGVASDRWRLYYQDLARVRVRVPTDREAAAMGTTLDEMRTAEHAATVHLQRSQRLLEALRRQSLGS